MYIKIYYVAFKLLYKSLYSLKMHTQNSLHLSLANTCGKRAAEKMIL